MIDMREAFHLGVRVVDLDAAMQELGPALDVRWASPRTHDAQPIWTPERGFQRVPLRFCYSVEGPLHIELLESSGGSFWDGRDAPGNHHVGVWVDDVDAETDRLISLGWSLEACRSDPGGGDGYGIFAYLQPPTGMLVEVVSREILPNFEAWWAGRRAPVPSEAEVLATAVFPRGALAEDLAHPVVRASGSDLYRQVAAHRVEGFLELRDAGRPVRVG